MQTATQTKAITGDGFMTYEDTRQEWLRGEERIRASRNEAERAGELTSAEQAEITKLHAADAVLTARLDAAGLDYATAVRALRASDRTSYGRDSQTGDTYLITIAPSDRARLEAAARSARDAFQRTRDDVQREQIALSLKEREILGVAEARQHKVQLGINLKSAAAYRRERGIPEPEPVAERPSRLPVRFRR